MTLETMAEVHRRLGAAGFVEQLVVDGGRLRSTRTGDLFDPRDVSVAELVRFEGPSDPADEALVLAVATRRGSPLGTITTAYGPTATAEEAEAMRHLHRIFVSDEERAAHDDHDHIGAVFADRRSAEAAIADLREVGLGSEHLGTALRQGDRVVLEHDESEDFLHDVEAGAGTGAVLGLLGGMLVFSLALPGIGTLGAGGILAVGAATGIGGAMLGGYAGVGAADRDLVEHERLGHQPIGPGEVMLVACSHDHPELVVAAMERHGGRLLPEPVDG
jgi:hypothetical protein